MNPRQIFHRRNIVEQFFCIYIFFTYVLVTRRKSVEKATGVGTGTGTGTDLALRIFYSGM